MGSDGSIQVGGVHMSAARTILTTTPSLFRETRPVLRAGELPRGSELGASDDDKASLISGNSGSWFLSGVGSASRVLTSETASLRVQRLGRDCDETWASLCSPLGDLIRRAFHSLNALDTDEGGGALMSVGDWMINEDALHYDRLTAAEGRALPSALKYMTSSCSTTIATAITNYLDGLGMIRVAIAFCLRSASSSSLPDQLPFAPLRRMAREVSCWPWLSSFRYSLRDDDDDDNGKMPPMTKKWHGWIFRRREKPVV